MKVVFLSIIGYSYHNERNGGFNMTVKIGEKAPDFKLLQTMVKWFPIGF